MTKMPKLESLTMTLGLLYAAIGIVAGIWLALIGRWGIIGYGMLLLFISIFGLISALMPGMIFIGPAMALHKKGKKKPFFIMSCLGMTYSMLVLSTWCIAVLYHYAKNAEGNAYLPTLLWSYAVAIGPVLWISQKDLQRGDLYAMINTAAAQAGCLLVITAGLFVTLPLPAIILLFTPIMIGGLVMGYRIASKTILGPVGETVSPLHQ